MDNEHSDKQICPLSMAQSGKLGLCVLEKCAWYDDVTDRCAVLLLAQQIHGVATPEGELLVVVEDPRDNFVR